VRSRILNCNYSGRRYQESFVRKIFICCRLSTEELVKWYKSMTLLNTMDKILYESQRQVNTVWLLRLIVSPVLGLDLESQNLPVIT
jgi:hypothetical protein